ncbi:M56 family metallopeptidase [Bacillus sp. FJAT-29790]|uniref:M56 family metallopeptidase n=1 Tax=Bacillus sp. FJAT-29790 TaxID=1895002 RepID=UPI001C22B987|nr:M56 family metallopeptidase [Bacillus sp. FJAT-29790]MBU8878852.1 M56 family metallopeptidase [Bacillus sp. FJAT-29790]
MSHFLELLVTLTVAGSTVVGCILLLRLISPHVFPAKWRYVIGKMAVWFYVFPIAFIVKWLIQLLTLKPVLDVLTLGISIPIRETSTRRQTGLISEQTIPDETAWILLILWGMGALTFAIWQMYCYHRFMRRMKDTNSPVSKDSEAAKQLASLKRVLGINGSVQLAYSSSIKSPVLVGLLKPTIFLPMSDKLDMDLGMVIHHELVHLKRKDLMIKMLVLGAGALHWFNPFVHFLRKDIHIWSELSCDEEVVEEMSYAERKRYGETILNVMIGSRGLPVRFCASLSGDGKQLKRRLAMMLNVKKLKKHTVFMAATTILVIGAIGTSTAVWAAKSTPEIEGVGTEQFATEEKGGSHIDDNAAYDYTFEGLSPEQQKRVTKEMAQYYLDEQGNVVHFTDLDTKSVPFESLNAEQQQQATKELGHYSLRKVRKLNNK